MRIFIHTFATMRVRERKMPVTIIIKPSIKKKAAAKAAKDKVSLSQLIENLLSEYIQP